MPTTSDDPQSDPAALDEEDDPTAIADDGMAPLINNTGADDTEGDDADATSG